jgi:four helix bundle protein
MKQGYERLRIYQISYEMAVLIHRETQELPKEERYELGSQMRRAAISIPLNIAEGYARKQSQADFAHFIAIALGSCNETTVLLNLARDLGYLVEEKAADYLTRYQELGKQINVFHQKLKSSKSQNRNPSNV